MDVSSLRSRLPQIAMGVLAVWAIAITFVHFTGGSDQRAQVRGAAITFITELTTWDATEGLDDTIAELRALGTGEFLDQIEEVLSDEARATAEAVGARSRGEIIEVLVSEIDGDQASAIVIVNQTLTVDGEAADQEQVSRMEFRLVDGKWLVERSELLNAPTPLGAIEEGS